MASKIIVVFDNVKPSLLGKPNGNSIAREYNVQAFRFRYAFFTTPVFFVSYPSRAITACLNAAEQMTATSF